MNAVGPIVSDRVAKADKELLASCYRSCLELAFKLVKNKDYFVITTEVTIRNMVEQQKDMRIPSGLLPVCPHCGKPITMNLRSDNRFVEDEGWHLAAENPKAVYVCINYGEAVCPKEIEKQAICIDGDIGQILQQITG